MTRECQFPEEIKTDLVLPVGPAMRSWSVETGLQASLTPQRHGPNWKGIRVTWPRVTNWRDVSKTWSSLQSSETAQPLAEALRAFRVSTPPCQAQDQQTTLM